MAKGKHNKMRQKNHIYRLIVFIALLGYFYSLWQPQYIKKISFDNFGRLIAISGKKQVSCPVQTANTAVFLVIGQSNSANYAEKHFVTSYPENVINYFDGKCYVAASPLLGADGEEGEFITPLADILVKEKIFESVIILSSGIGGTPISRWEAGGDLNKMMLDVVAHASKDYKITGILWHQGESDFYARTTQKLYISSFNSLRSSLLSTNVIAPMFISVSTKCLLGLPQDLMPFNSENPVAIAQKSLVDNKTILLGVDTDALLEKSDRRDGCHFSESGQLKAAVGYASAIKNFYNPQ